MPYIGYWQLMAAVDKYVVYDDVNFIKRGWANRNNLLLNGEPHMFSISLNGASQNKLFNEIEVADDFSKLRKTIYHCYSKAPMYETTMNLLDEIFDYPDKNLARFVYHSFQVVLDYINCPTELVMSSSIDKDNSLKGQDKILEICHKLHYDKYINTIAGEELYVKSKFIENGITLNFLQASSPVYKQFSNSYVPNLSMIDVLMFNTVPEIREQLNQYTLI